jgi:ribosomal protein L11 methyltransferase
MRWNEIKITFQGRNPGMVVELISDLFYDLGVKGVVVDDPQLKPEQEWAPDALPLPEQPAVTGYLPQSGESATQCRQLEQALAELAESQQLDYSIAYRMVDEKDWAESWKNFFRPQEITRRIVVKPTWRDYTPRPDQLVIEIDPGMAFGTGTHPTTALCMAMLETYITPGVSVLDVGTGSGILLIEAAKLGAAHLAGIDLDPDAIHIARQNLVRNAVPKHQYTLQNGHLLSMVDATYDIVVANILAEIILELLDQVGRALKPGGIFICSGIIEAFQSGVLKKMAACGFSILDLQKQDDWVAIAGRIENVLG